MKKENYPSQFDLMAWGNRELIEYIMELIQKLESKK